MVKCSKCNGVPSENDVMGWKCNSCGKTFKTSKTQLHNVLMKKKENSEQTFLRCPVCKSGLDDGNETIVWKCSCGSLNRGKLKDFEEEVENVQKSNLIKCPECGMEISSRAKRCVHCGKIFVKDIFPKKFCSDCGKEIPIGALECPYCGCPIEGDREEYALKSEKGIRKYIKKFTIKFIISITAIVVIASIAALIINFVGSNLNEDEQLAYQNAVEMKSMMRDSDSFRLYDEMFLLKHRDDDGNVDYTYTIFKYGGANGYGAVTTDEAIFKDGEYIMDYADEPDEDDRNYMKQLGAKADLALYMISGGGEHWEMIDIDIEKIKKKMGIE